MIELSQVDFETEELHLGGVRTEDAGLQILTRLAKRYRHEIFITERVAPDGLGEFDAICCMDSGLVVVDFKRWAGDFYPFAMRDEQICVVRERGAVWVDNPIRKVLGKTSALLREHLKSPEWASVRRAFSGQIPVHTIVCFGPTTTFDEMPEPDDRVSVCTTRTLVRAVEDRFTANPGVVGAGAQLQGLTSVWPRWGVLTTQRKGVLRCAIWRIQSSDWDAAVWGLQSLESDGRKLKLQYQSGRKLTLPADEPVYLRAYVQGAERQVRVPANTRFRWRLTGR
ncbi:MAG: NERD domain-containing protein [Burkholderiales bacterium]|nr:NERD domain-containing protein [Burkholderiales bacterium]